VQADAVSVGQHSERTRITRELGTQVD